MRNPSAKNHKAIWILSSLLFFLLSTGAYTCISQNQLCYYYFRQQSKEGSLMSFHPLIYQPSVYSSIQVQKTHTCKNHLIQVKKKFIIAVTWQSHTVYQINYFMSHLVNSKFLEVNIITCIYWCNSKQHSIGIFRYMYVERGEGWNPTKMSLTSQDYPCQVVQWHQSIWKLRFSILTYKVWSHPFC